ncbi:HEXXH motif-containing putative peptide modification protein [Nonomuraea angiospora]|uniref:HEXXH motif domain-containing protein n=1 Tax=Nonomuraea angiospora TaxID=46172 RepID=A0ABR9LNS4_9ACTN|nr:HEXXH motif-containing putative peptide modification protein [Nonomuraea angiospora]MBE1582305.1 hypothetical protein [Nonomuraea angiospora]
MRDKLLSSLDAALPGWRESRMLTVPAAVEDALLVHTLYECGWAGRESDVRRARDAFQVWRTRPDAESVLDLGDRSVAVVGAGSCRRTDDRNHGSPVYSVTGDCLAAPSPVSARFVGEALGYVEDSGLGAYLDHGLGVVVLVTHREFDGMLESYSLSSFPGTMWVDHSDDALRLGEVLLHESGHTWLNLCLAALDERLPAEPLWHSPWKDTPRPAFGILHAALSFSLLIQYFRHYSGEHAPDERMRRYCAFRARVEAGRMGDTVESVQAAAGLLRSPELRDTIMGEVWRAVGSHAH